MLLTTLKSLWDKTWLYLALAGALLAGLFALRQSGKAAGREEIQRKVNEAERAAAQRARHVENETAAMDDDSVADELIRDWVRDSKRR